MDHIPTCPTPVPATGCSTGHRHQQGVCSKMPLTQKTVAIIGAGNMGEALVRGLLAKKAITARQLIAADVQSTRLELFERQFGIAVVNNNIAASRDADIVLLAIKPQQMSEILADLRPAITPRKLVISIAAGVTTARIERELGDSTPVVRVMPNTPAQIGEGIAALCKGRHATDEHMAAADAVLSAVGTTVRTDERFLDAVTALSGSGPAYVFLIAEAMIQAGIEVGLDEDMARKLSLQTIAGAAKLMMETDEGPFALRRKVTSPNGTTEAAIKVMADGKLVELLVQAVKAAAQRSRELSAS